MKHTTLALFLFIFTSSFFNAKGEDVPGKKKPNVIMILVDDMGWMDSSTYGSKYYQTPNMTRLAKEGMRFTDAYAASPLCSPTRASIMSGQYPARLRMTVAVTPKSVDEPKALKAVGKAYCGKVQSKSFLPLEVYTLAEALKDGGYSTAHIGKWHLAHEPKHYAEHQGFDHVIGGATLPGPPDYYSPYARRGSKSGIRNLKAGPKGEYLNERLAEESIKWMDSVKGKAEPFYLNLWHYAVHGPIIAKKDLLPKYQKLRDPKADQRCPEMATMLESMDNSIGILLDWLDQPENKAIKANTLIIMTSDNGGVTHKATGENIWTSNRPLRGGKANTYEGGTRAPWIVSWPGIIEAATVNETPIQSIDIYPTVLEAAKLKRKSNITIDGQSILPLFMGEKMEHQPIHTDFPHTFGVMCAPSSSVRAGNLKLIRYYHAGQNAKSHAYELFDLKRDPYESINLAEVMPEKVRELDSLIEAHLADTQALTPLPNPQFKGNPRRPRSNPKKAPERPNKLSLPKKIIKTDKSGIKRLQLTDDNNKPRQTHAIVLDGSEWVQLTNNSDGSVTVTWDKPKGQATLLLGWKGGSSCFEINDWTFPPSKLVISGK